MQCLVFVIFSFPLFAQNCPEFTGAWPYGVTEAVGGEGDVAVFSSGTMLMTADISDAEAPVILGELEFGERITEIKVEGGFAYLTDRTEERLSVIDLSDPSQPTVAGSLSRMEGIPNGGWNTFDVEAGLIFLPDGPTVRFIDVSNPNAPAEVGLYESGGYSPIGPLVAEGSLLYLMNVDAIGDRSLKSFDVSDPTNLVELGSVDLDGYGIGKMSIGDELLVGAVGWDGLLIFDISDPTALRYIGKYDDWNTPIDGVAMAGNLAYLVSSTRIQVIDLAVPGTPAVLDEFSTYVSDFEVTSDQLLVGSGKGLSVVDSSDPANLRETAIITTFGPVEDVLTVGEWTFVAGGTSGLHVLDTSNPAEPNRVGWLATNPPGIWDFDPSEENLALMGHFLLSSNNSYPGLRVIDIEDPTEPEETSSFNCTGPYVIAVEQPFVFLVNAYQVTVVDLSDPTNPFEVTTWYPGVQKGEIVAATAQEGQIFVASRYGLWIVDVSNPQAPIEVSATFPFEDQVGRPVDMVVADDVAYVALEEGLSIVDVSDPTAPVETGFLAAEPNTELTGVDLWGDYAIVSGRDEWGQNRGFIEVIDVSHPLNPTSMGYFELQNEVAPISVSESFVAAGSPTAGLSFFDLTACTLSPPVAAFSVAPDFPKADEPVSFSDLSAGSPTEWLWNFGDGSSSPNQNPEHMYRAAGEYTVSLTVSNGTGSDNTTKTVTIDPAGDRIYIPAVGAGPGVGDSLWSSDVVINNRGSSQLTYEILFLQKGEDNTTPLSGGTFRLDPGVSASYTNVLDLFGISSGSGALCFTSEDLNGAILASRTKSTDSDGATFGQGIPAVAEEDLILPGQKVRLIGLFEYPGLRTNIGFFNASLRQTYLSISFFDTHDHFLGEDSLTLAPFSFQQWNKAFERVNAGVIKNGWVEVSSSEGRFFTFASVVDNLKDDPTYVLPQAAIGPSRSRVYIPAAATGSGVGSSMWSTDVVLHRRGTSSVLNFDVSFLPRASDNSDVEPVGPISFVRAEDGRSQFYPDIVADLFGLQEASGTLRFDFHESSGSSDFGEFTLLTSRTKNTDEDGATFGQGVPAVVEDDLIPADTRVRLIQLSQNRSLRTNVGFMNGRDFPITIFVAFYDDDGSELGTDAIVLQPYSFDQWNRAFNRVGKTNVDNGYVDVWSTTPNALFYTYASVIDMVKDDPTYVMPQ